MRKSASDIWRPGYFLQGRLTFNRRRRAAVIDGRGGDLIRLIEGLAALVAENGRCRRPAPSGRACSTGTPFAFTSAASQGGSRTLRWQERGVDALRIPSHRHPQTTLNQIGRSLPPRRGCSSTTRVSRAQGGTGARRGQRQLGANLKRSCERSRSTVPISASQFELGARRRFSSERNKGFR